MTFYNLLLRLYPKSFRNEYGGEMRAVFARRRRFKPEGVLTLTTDLPMPEYRLVATREAYYSHVLQDVRALPGVTAAGYISFLPMSTFRGGIWPVAMKGDEAAADIRSANNVAGLRYVTPGFFQAMGMTLIRGRGIDESDGRGRQFVAVVSESFVRRYWPNQDPIDRHFTFAFADRVVVGGPGTFDSVAWSA
jgi:hypothetical protein